MEKANDEKKREYDVASEEIANFIDEIIVNKLIKKMEEQSKTTKEANGKLVTIDQSLSEAIDNSKIAKDKVNSILKLLLKDPMDTEILDCEEEYEDFDLVKHSTWERERIECLINRPEFNVNPIFERITNESNRVKSEIVTEVVERLVTENLSQKEKTQEIIKILINQDKKKEDIQSDKYYHFDIVDNMNLTGKNIEVILEKILAVDSTVSMINQEQVSMKNQLLGVLIKEEGDTIPRYFDNVTNKIETDLKEERDENRKLCNSIEKKIKEYHELLLDFSLKYDNNNDNIQGQLNGVLSKLEKFEEDRKNCIKEAAKKLYIFGGIIIFFQILSIVLSFIPV